MKKLELNKEIISTSQLVHVVGGATEPYPWFQQVHLLGATDPQPWLPIVFIHP